MVPVQNEKSFKIILRRYWMITKEQVKIQYNP
jgi:hypothetical protein